MLEVGAEPKLRNTMEEFLFFLQQATVLDWIVSGSITGYIMQYFPRDPDEMIRMVIIVEHFIRAWMDQGWLVAAPAGAPPRFRFVSYT